MPKKDNTFRFVSFLDRLKNIHVDIIRHRGCFSELPGRDADSFFYEALEKWSDMNGTRHFDDFRIDIPSDYDLQSYAQILHHQEALSEALRRHLSVENSLCLQALLQLTIAFGRDLQKDFYESGHFWPFFDTILSLIIPDSKTSAEKTKTGGNYDPDLLENAFSTLAHLFKLCWRPLALRLADVYDRFRPLLNHRRPYLRRFASEALSFLVRKSTDLKSFLVLCFKQNEENLSDLLFEAVRGSAGHLHSKAAEMVSTTLDLLDDNDDTIADAAFEVSENLHKKISTYAVGEIAKPVLVDVLLKRAISLLPVLKERPENRVKTIRLLEKYLRLLIIWRMNSKRGTFFDVCFPSVVRNLLMPLVDDDLVTGTSGMNDFHSAVLELASSIFGHRGVIDECRGEFERFSKKMLSSIYDDVISIELRSKFITTLAETSSEGCGIAFETICLRGYGELAERMLSTEEKFDTYFDTIMSTYCHILNIKNPIYDDVNDDHSYDLYPGRNFINLKRVLENQLLKATNSDYDASKLACIVSIFSMIASPQSSWNTLTDFLAKIINQSENFAPLVLYAAIHSLTKPSLQGVALGKLSTMLSIEKWIDILEMHRSANGFVWSVRAAERYFTVIEPEGLISSGQFRFAVEKLSGYFMDSSHSVRIAVAQLLSCLKRLCTAGECNESNGTVSIFNVFHEAESVFPLAMDNYRDRLLHLRKLAFEEYDRYIPSELADAFNLVPLKMLLGQLHVNFALLWDPIVDLICTHLRGFGIPGNGDNARIFWQFFSDALRVASENVATMTNTSTDIDHTDPFHVFWHHPQSAAIDDDRRDDLNFRYLLWRVLENCPPQCVEWKSRSLSGLILDFAEKELKLFNDDPAKAKWENLVDGPGEQALAEDGGKRNGGLLIKTMIAMLKTYSRFKNMKGIAEEPTLAKLYNKLLMHQRRDVQKAALECVFAYKSKNLLPYKENFESLLDDSKFRDALVLFQIDYTAPEGSAVDPKHRASVITILMRLLYGLMLGKTGSARRKMPIFHFLAGCSEEELKEFLRLLLVPVEACLAFNDGPLLDRCQSIVDTYDIRQSVCPRQLLGIFSTLHIVFRKLGHLFSHDSKIGFWRLLTITSGIVERLRSERKAERVHRKYWRAIKELHRSLLTLLVDFFVCFGDDFNLTSAQHNHELKTLFVTTCSEKNLEKFSSGEGASAAAGGLLSLFYCWSQRPKLSSFMAFSLAPSSKTPISSCVQLLLRPGCPRDVQNRVVTILRDLTSHPSITCATGGTVEGVALLQPHVADLLSYMERKLSIDSATSRGDSSARRKGKNGAPGVSLTELDLQLLSKLTACVSDEKASECLISLLLPGLSTKLVKTEAAQADALFTICRLAKNVHDCDRFHGTIARLFSIIRPRNCRILLCELWCAAFVDNRRPSDVPESEWEEWEFMGKAIRDWNSWDPKRLDEPDYGRRTSAYNETRKRIENNQLVHNVNFCRLILHECSFVVLETEDISLRDNASYALRKLVEFLPTALKDQEPCHPLINTDLLPILKRGVKSRREEVRLEFVAVLASAVHAFPRHPRFVGLDALAPRGGDPETDFFENLKHMQLHRRGRALKRLCEKIVQENAASVSVDEMTPAKIAADTIYFYILPVCLPWPYVDTIVARQSQLVEHVIRLVTTYALHQASWKRYEALMKYFLNRLQKDAEKRKVTVRLLTGLLDGFRFNLKDVKIECTDHGIGGEFKNVDAVDESAALPQSESEEGGKTKLKIFSSLTKNYLPRLQKTLSQPLQTETVHKMMEKAHYDEDEQILKIPIALAMIKLLKQLPVSVLESSLPGIQYKVCQLLKSRSFSIREQTRKTLCEMTIELGPRYLPFVIREMRSILTRGYQIHVLIFTVHAILSALSDALRPGDLDSCLGEILEICNEDLFGGASEEKEVVEVTKNLKEARAQKTYATYGVLGRLIGVGCLDKALQPLKQTLETKHTYKTVLRVSDALRHFVTGIIQNVGLTEEMVFILAHRTLTSCLPMLSMNYEKRNPDLHDMDDESNVPVRQRSCLILDPEPGRSGALSTTPKVSRQSNIHVIAEFALDALFLTLKKAGKPDSTAVDDVAMQKRLAMLDPFVELLYQCSTTVYSKTVAYGLRCFCYLAQWYSDELPSFQNADIVRKVLDRLFVLFSQYAGLGRAGNPAKGSEFAAAAEVLALAFKTMATVIQNSDSCNLNADQLKLLLHYVDEDLLDARRQATAFALIRAILTKKYRCEKDVGGNDLLTTVMKRVQDMSIQGQAEHIRSQCRHLVLRYANNYGLLKGNKCLRFFRFYCAQLSYEYEDGRISALECLNLIFDYAGKKSLNTCASMVFVFLAMRLIEDESAKCKKVVGVTLKNLIRKIEPSEVNSLLAMALAWLRHDKILYKQLGAHLLGIFVEAEAEKFRNRLVTVLPVLSAEMSKTMNQASLGDEAVESDDQDEASMDRTIYLLLVTVKKICDHCPSLMRNEPEWNLWMNEIWDCIKSLLRYPHQWVQLMANQLFGMLFASYSPEELSLQATDSVRSQEYLMKDCGNEENGTPTRPERIWRELSEAFIGSLRMRDCQAALAEQAIKNLIFVARVLINGSIDPVDDANTCSIAWLSNRLIRLCRLETSKSPKCFTKRSCVFKWIAAVALHVQKEQLDTWLPLVLPPLYREMTITEGTDSETKQLASEVCDFLKTRIAGIDEYSRHWVTCQRAAADKRITRKRKIAEEAVTNPEAGARRKMRKHKKKAESRKRKLAVFGQSVKRRRRDKDLSNLVLEECGL